MRIGAVSYLNTKPLVEGLAALDEVDVEFDLPSRLAARLAAGEFDVALIPAIAAASRPDYEVISDACIACRGPVWSVKLLSRVPFAEIGSLALDEGSRTSVALVQILLDRLEGVRPTLAPFPIGSEVEDLDTDAALIIGDRAMIGRREAFPYQWDLGEQWRRWSGDPFVFAVWTARGDRSQLGFEEVLSQARDAGLSRLERIASEEAPRYGLPYERCLEYLRDNLHFILGPAERRGLRRYLQEARRLDLIASDAELRFHDCPIT